MAEAGLYTPETARIIHEVVSYLRASGFTVDRRRRVDQEFRKPEAPIYIRNDSGAEIPAFGCVQAIGTADIAGQNYITVDQPADTDGSSGWYLFNGIAPIEIDGFGIAHDGPVVRMLTDGSTITNAERWAPKVDSFEVEPSSGGPFIAIGEDDIKPDVMRGFAFSASSEKIVKLPSGGISGRTTSTMQSGTCTIQEVNATTGALSDSSDTITAYNLSPNKLEGTDPRDGTSPMYALASLVGGVYTLSPMPWTTELQTVQSDTRWNSTGLEIEQWLNLPMPVKDKEAWNTIAEREPC